MNITKAGQRFLEKTLPTALKRGGNEVSSNSILNQTELTPLRKEYKPTTTTIGLNYSFSNNIQQRAKIKSPGLFKNLGFPISYTKDPLNQKEQVKNAIANGGHKLPKDPSQSAWLVEETHRQCLNSAVNIIADLPALGSAKTTEVDKLKFPTGWNSTLANPVFKVLTAEDICRGLDMTSPSKKPLRLEKLSRIAKNM